MYYTIIPTKSYVKVQAFKYETDVRVSLQTFSESWATRKLWLGLGLVHVLDMTLQVSS